MTSAVTLPSERQQDRAEWMAVHIHYTSNPNPLLAACLGPMLEELEADGQITQFFFIRYWLEGPHVRLRLRPAPGVDPDALAARVEQCCAEFFRKRPAVYEVDAEQVEDMYHSMFLSEYTQEEWDARYGSEGRMPIQPNNSVHRAQYAPEYTRYGGSHGMELSEWHFEQSSRHTIDLVSRVNMHLRTVTFGLSTQMMVVMAGTFIPDRARLHDFLENYEDYWARLYVDSDVDWKERYELAMEDLDSRVPQRLRDVHDFTLGLRESSVAFLNSWRDHCRALRDRIEEATAQGLVTFGTEDDGKPLVVDDSEQTLQVFLGSFLHMHNNRMGVTPNDESYLAHVLHGSLSSRADADS